MSDIRNIVVATDFSPGADAALEKAVQLAVLHGASLRLLHAFDVGAWHGLKGVFDAERLIASPPFDMRMRQRLSDLATDLSARNHLKVEANFSVGAAHSAVHAFVAAHAPSLVVMGSRSTPRMLGLGSTATKVLRAPGCPVLVVRGASGSRFETVLSGVDMREVSVRAARVAVQLFPDAHHHLLHAVDPTLELRLWMGQLDDEQIRLAHDSLYTTALQQIELLARELTVGAAHPVEADVVADAAARAILDRAVALSADCVVVGHHGEGSVAEHLLGSMAQQVLHHTLRDVLVVP